MPRRTVAREGLGGGGRWRGVPADASSTSSASGGESRVSGADDLSRDATALLSAMVTSTYKLQHESIALGMLKAGVKDASSAAKKNRKATSNKTPGKRSAAFWHLEGWLRVDHSRWLTVLIMP